MQQRRYYPKLIALKKIFNIIKNSGRLYLKDTVYSFDVNNYRDFFNNWIATVHEIADDLQLAIRDEYSTIDWIMEELLQCAGFNIERKEYIEGFMAVYICTKKNDL